MKYLSLIIIFLLTSSIVYSQDFIFQNYHHTSAINSILPNYPGIGGGGTIEVEIKDDEFKLRIVGSFTSTELKLGKLFSISSTPGLPYLDLGVISSDYQLVIKNSELHVNSLVTNPQKIASINFNKRISLASIMRTKIVERKALIPLGPDLDNPSLTSSQKEQILVSSKYHDGLGRVIQQNQNRKHKNDELISSIHRNGYGEISKTSLPGAIESNNKGKYYTEIENRIKSFYDLEFGAGEGDYAYNFTEKEYDKSELHIQSSLPGLALNSGSANNRSFLNTVNEANEVIWFGLSGNGQIIHLGFYPEASLDKKIEADKNKGEKRFRSITFTDFFGNEILKRIQNGNTYDDHYSIYDLKGRLKYMIQAEGFARLKGNWALLNDPDFRFKWMFEFEYNSKNQLIIKSIPGRGLEYLIYDKKNRLILSQNPLQRQNNKWTYYLYDVQDRMIMSGEKIHNHGILSLQNQVKTVNQNFPSNINEERNASILGYTQRSFQSNQSDINLIKYFDNYDFDGDGALDYQYISDPANQFASIQSIRTQPYTLLSGEVIYLDSKNGDNITKAFFYDYKNRIVQEQRHYSVLGDGFTDLIFYKYDFTNRIISKKTIHRYNEIGTVCILENTKYDITGNILESKWKVNNEEEIIVNSNSYDTLDYLLKKRIHSRSNKPGFLQSNHYKHDIIGRLVSINGQQLNNETSGNGNNANHRAVTNQLKFAMALDYSSFSSADFVPNYNGNISKIRWRNTLSDNSESYDYYYDQKGQLIGARYSARDAETSSWTKDMDKYSIEGIIYDRNGNINAIKRKGNIQSGQRSSSTGLIDDLIYRYNGNQVFAVDDNAIEHGERDFFDYGYKGLENQEYIYDVNGNLIEDVPRSLSYEYNSSDLLKRVNLGNDTEVKYTYDAQGNKIIEITQQGQFNVTYRYYGDFIYENGKLHSIVTSFGRLVPESINSNFLYEYAISDHIGNIRLRFCDLDKNGILNSTDILEEQNYYPFGMRMPVANSQVSGLENRHYFSSKKELHLVEDLDNDGIKEGSIDILDFGARNYEPSIASWRSIDKRADAFQTLSPYSFNKNNPIRMIDKLGLAWNPVYTSGHLSGYEWVPEDESYDEDGNLREGLYRQAIFFTNASSINNNWGIGTSEAVVYLSDGSIERFDAHTTTSDGNSYPVIPDGLYEAGYGMHNNDYYALRVGDRGTENFYNNRIELGFENPSYSDGRTYAEGINIHKAGLRNFTGITTAGNPISAGCLLIDRERWQEFISNFEGFESNYTVGVGVSRFFNQPINNYYIPIHLRALNLLRLYDEDIDLTSPQTIKNR